MGWKIGVGQSFLSMHGQYLGESYMKIMATSTIPSGSALTAMYVAENELG